MSQYVAAFNNQFEELVEDIERIFPNDNEISSASRGLKNLRRITPKLIIRVFYEYVDKPYGAYIHDNNLQYFLEKDYKEDLSKTMQKTERRQASQQLARVVSLGDVIRPKILANSDQLASDLDRIINLTKSAVERNRPADADKALRFLPLIIESIKSFCS